MPDSKGLRGLASGLIGAALTAVCPMNEAQAWGSSGHRMITVAALSALPANVPNFVRRGRNIEDAGEWSREPDRWRLAGAAHDALRDAFHYAYTDDDGRLGGGPGFLALPATVSAYQAAVRKAGGDPDQTGYLPYAIIDGWQQVAKDFVYWRADCAGLKSEHAVKRRGWLQADKRRREVQIIHDIGLFAHYVGDATQPMHLTVHHDGWGDYPNPDGFTSEKVHVPYEGAYVGKVVTQGMVSGGLRAALPMEATIEVSVGTYLQQASAATRPWYELEKAGGFKPGDRRGVDFTAGRLAMAASELRDLVAAAWLTSASGRINYPVATLANIEAGRVDTYSFLKGPD